MGWMATPPHHGFADGSPGDERTHRTGGASDTPFHRLNRLPNLLSGDGVVPFGVTCSTKGQGPPTVRRPTRKSTWRILGGKRVVSGGGVQDRL